MMMTRSACLPLAALAASRRAQFAAHCAKPASAGGGAAGARASVVAGFRGEATMAMPMHPGLVAQLLETTYFNAPAPATAAAADQEEPATMAADMRVAQLEFDEGLSAAVAAAAELLKCDCAEVRGETLELLALFAESALGCDVLEAKRILESSDPGLRWRSFERTVAGAALASAKAR
mmetsp:Transcript_108613/g.312920  ORF Transcript_108613/g.312920 Transcript_108613/m.312920 type:complete len:178 (-) Transcript_108613:218-751(-)